VGLGLAIIASTMALLAVHRLPDLHPPRPQSQPILAAIRDGARFVAREAHLRGIAICAIFWNAAFFGVLAIFAVYAREVLALSADATGASWAAYGAGAMLGALFAARALSAMPPGVIFVFGPASSALGAIILASGRGDLATPTAAIGFFSFGFGPMLWLIAQTSLRQLLTPAEMMGRVGATITAANYGVRPIGALGTGWIAAEYGAAIAMWVPAVLFVASAIAILFSPLPALKAMPEAASPTG
jgi:predicted MFS family arabinose efflux permease